jgi:histidinol-phosphate aminotransferase
MPHLIRPLVQRLKPYVPGEQPKIKGLIKLNTNENPYPPSDKVIKAIQKAADGRLRLYPNPTSEPLREKLSRMHGCKVEQIILGNGSDELLALATRAFTEPADPVSAGKARTNPASTIQYFVPSYSLYPVLADIHGAARNEVALNPDFSMPSVDALCRGGRWDFKASLTFVTTPNAPSGTAYQQGDLDALCQAQKGVVVLDEAYVDFAREHSLGLALKHSNVLVARTFSKAYSLCFQRVGYLVGNPELVEALNKIKDSYNVNGLGQVAALATLDDLPYYRANFQKVIATRERLSRELTTLGFHVQPSQTNFILARPPGPPAQQWLESLRENRILVRWFNLPEVKDWLRITIGTDREISRLLRTVKNLLKKPQ